MLLLLSIRRAPAVLPLPVRRAARHGSPLPLRRASRHGSSLPLRRTAGRRSLPFPSDSGLSCFKQGLYLAPNRQAHPSGRLFCLFRSQARLIWSAPAHTSSNLGSAFNVMFSAATAVAIPPAVSYYFPEKLARIRRISWCCRMARDQAGYSQLEVRKVTYRPPGTEQNLLNEINLSLREKSFGLIFGRSGSGKTTLLQLLAGLSEPTSGSICIQKYDDSGNPIGLSELLTSQRVGIVFQFPERYFLADTVLEEVTFGWPRQKADLLFKEQLALNLQNAFKSVGLTTISLDEDPQSLSGGFKRRLALAIQLVQTPDLLLLDEPLAGLDWKARADVVNLLKDLKKHHTILVVSHDLRELYPLVDHSWRMEMGGSLKEEALPV